jgi:hypothetical protein
MDWTTLAKLALVVAVIAAQWPAVRKQWLEDRAGTVKTLRLLLYYFLFLGIGLFVLIGFVPEGGASKAESLAAVGFIFGWLLLGASWLIKLVPRYRTVPAWLLRPLGPFDIVALIVIAATLVVLLV